MLFIEKEERVDERGFRKRKKVEKKDGQRNKLKNSISPLTSPMIP
jgi:hypothetical protein